jgi:hypothetical protein
VLSAACCPGRIARKKRMRREDVPVVFNWDEAFDDLALQSKRMRRMVLVGWFNRERFHESIQRHRGDRTARIPVPAYVRVTCSSQLKRGRVQSSWQTSNSTRLQI